MKHLMTFAVLALFSMVQSAWSHPPCTTADVSGTYAFQADGLVLVPGTPITGPFMRIGSFNTDGAGNVNVHTLAVYNGLDFGLESFSGTYTVSGDCSITFNLAVPAPINAPSTFQGFVADGGDDIMFMLTNITGPGAPPAITTVLGHGRRQKLNSCKMSQFQGNFRIELNGVEGIPVPFPANTGSGAPERLLGQLQLNNGVLTAAFIESKNGIINQQNTSGTYTVNSDCTFALSFTLDGSPTGVNGSLISESEAFVVLNPPALPTPLPGVTFNGTVATGTMLSQTKVNEDQGNNGHGNDGGGNHD
jgi:hypothetical protein